jgi:tetratricopeptide (TPR) repeat protein
LKTGVDYFNDANGKKARAAADAFEEALQILPGQTEALYDLMIARTVNGEFNESAAVARTIINLQRYHQLADLAVLGQAYLHLSWAAYHNGSIDQAWKYYRNSVDESSWGKATEDEPVQDQSFDTEVGS